MNSRQRLQTALNHQEPDRIPLGPQVRVGVGRPTPQRTAREVLRTADDQTRLDWYATSQIAQTTLRSVLGQVELDDLLSQRDKINRQLQEIIDRHTEPWGVKVSAVEVKQIDLPEEMRRSMAGQAEAERERRAKVIAAEGEYQASTRLAEAAAQLVGHVHRDALHLFERSRRDDHRELHASSWSNSPRTWTSIPNRPKATGRNSAKRSPWPCR